MRPTTSSCILYSASLLFTSIAGATSTSTGINSTDIPQQYGRQDPSVVRKMSDDEGEKFYFDYWSWDDTFLSSSSAKRGVVNTSAIELVEPQPAMLLHTSTDADLLLSAEEEKRDYARFARRALFALLGRDFQCPTGTFSCSAIGQPASCCGNGATCIIVQDTGLGVVGCCPAGETCGETVSSCGSGYTSCPSSLGGGCCIPGYTCVTGGCAFVSTYTVTRQSTTFISSSTVSTAPTVPTVSTTSSSTHTATTTSTTSSPTSSSSTETSTTVSPVPPVRPTTSSQTTITSTTSSSLSSGISTCPTGFYACSAVYEGGCCRTGRDCDTTSCPATSSTTLINTDGVTIAVPTGSAATTASESSGSCATGWFSCAASAGGGCCPSGYVCGSSCTASSSGTATATVVKEQPGAGGRYVANVYFCGVMALLIAICFHSGF